jgi:hypothetical protein
MIIVTDCMVSITAESRLEQVLNGGISQDFAEVQLYAKIYISDRSPDHYSICNYVSTKKGGR